MRKLLYIFICSFLTSCFIGCDNDEVRILSKGKMEDVLYDYHLAQGMMNMNDPKSGELIYSVFAKHGITLGFSFRSVREKAMFSYTVMWPYRA